MTPRVRHERRTSARRGACVDGWARAAVPAGPQAGMGEERGSNYEEEARGDRDGRVSAGGKG